MNILVTSPYWKGALAVMRSLGRKGHKVSFISSQRYTAILFSKYCAERIFSPRETNKEEYMDFLLNLVKDKKYDVLIPVCDNTVEYCVEYRSRLEPYVRCLVSPDELVKLSVNKDEAYRFCLSHDILIPQTFFPQSLEDVRRIVGQMEYPCYAKKAKGCSGSGNTVIKEKGQMIKLFESMDPQEKWPVIQEYIRGPVVGFEGVCRNGQVMEYILLECLQGNPKGGTPVYRRTMFDPKFRDICFDIIQKLHWTGPIDMDFIQGPNGNFFFLEINPRIAGSAHYALKAGVDFPAKALELLTTENSSLRVEPGYKVGKRLRSVFPEEINLCLADKKHIFRCIFNFLNPRVSAADIDFSDPSLLFWQIKNAKWDIFDNLRHRVGG